MFVSLFFSFRSLEGEKTGEEFTKVCFLAPILSLLQHISLMPKDELFLLPYLLFLFYFRSLGIPYELYKPEEYLNAHCSVL